MQALVLDSDKNLSITEVPTPQPGPGEVLVKIKAAALNHRDIWIQKGMYPGIKLPSILGADGAGEVVELGDGVDNKWLGQEVVIYPAHGWPKGASWPTKAFRVLGMPVDGTFAEYIKIEVENLFPKPSYLSWTDAAAIPLAGLTAWRALMSRGGLQAGEKVLITGIGGGVAQVGLLLAVASGAEVYVSSSQQDKIDDAIQKGAKAGINYREEDWHEQLKEMSGGIDLVMDSSPLDELDRYLKFLNVGGRVAYYGATGHRKATFNLSKFFLRQIGLLGSTMGSLEDFAAMLQFVEDKQLVPPVHKVYPFSEVTTALSDLETGQQRGKLVIEL